MGLDDLEREDFATALGVVPLWRRPGPVGPHTPVMLVITGAWARPDDLSNLPNVVGEAWDVRLMRLPGNGVPTLSRTSVAAYGEAVSEILSGPLAARPTLLLGVSVGALVALAARADSIRRIVAVEPPLDTGKLWPLIGGLREQLRSRPEDREQAAFASAIFGVSADGVRGRTYFDLFEGLAAPVDVLVGDEPLLPAREVRRYPSFVDAPERAWLAARQGVSLHVARNAGHAAPHHDVPKFLDVLFDACAAVVGRRPR